MKPFTRNDFINSIFSCCFMLKLFNESQIKKITLYDDLFTSNRANRYPVCIHNEEGEKDSGIAENSDINQQRKYKKIRKKI